MSLWVEVRYGGEWYGEEPMQETRHDTIGALYRALSGRDRSCPWEALGRCTGRLYADGRDGRPRQVGWVFVARATDENDRSCPPPALRIAYVTVHDRPDTVTRTRHYATFGGSR